METWFLFIVTLCIAALIRAIFTTITTIVATKTPPGPPHIPIITSILWLRKSFSQLEPILRNLHAKHGPIVTLRIGSRPAIFISDRSLAHRTLVQNSAIFSDRPKPIATGKVLSANQHNISSASYGATWRALRRNLAGEMLHPSRVKSFSQTRKWVLDTLLHRLKSASSQSDSNPSAAVTVVSHLRYAMFCLLVFMCFGERLDDAIINDVERVQRNLLLNASKFSILNFWPKITGFLLRNRWNELLQLMKDQEDVLVPLIRARKLAKEGKPVNDVVSYVDTLLELELPEEKRKLNESEMVTLCSEFLNAGTDTTSTALEWVLANLVKYPRVQKNIVDEISDVMKGREDKEVKKEDLVKLPYLKAVILEGLRRHPPGHFVLPHAVTEDTVLDGYLVPKDGTVNFMVAEMGWDPQVWEEPMEFKPERFLNNEGKEVEGFDITGSKEIKMMPFGAGRRICPGYNLALMHLEYFVANLVWSFEWKVPEGGSVDLSEKQEFTMVMKYPLQAHLTPRI
ncbi:cytochrome P450 89A2-like [Lotus japonicus]|uniref:cytochrome P450 89A2-like n=1 Tax=Lotus japonicus TaxID=34305 RepID=UPI00258EC805|nr:cytochrome P450 89A2-like [Lotus japonicus]